MSTLRPIEEAMPSPASAWSQVGRRLENDLIRLVDGANPILVKETRQALKSRQFVASFFVVLASCWLVSFGGVALAGPEIYYSAVGGQLLLAYFAVLTFPLTVIVPYSAYRSLAGEQEDNTYDLLSITALSARQIVTGKLWSAAAQMMIYLCAVSPCIAFTYLLRGVDAFTIALLLTLAVVTSLTLSMFALLVGASSRTKQSQLVTSVALVLGLFGVFYVLLIAALGLLDAGVPREPEFWLVVLVAGAMLASTFGLMHAAASAQIAFSSENRATPLRRWMMVQQACLVGGMGSVYFAMEAGWRDASGLVSFFVVVAGMYWYFMGALMTSEWPHLSRRVQRSLPQTPVGRSVLGLFNPGPGTGYLFAVANLSSVTFAGLVVVWLTSGAPVTSRWSGEHAAYLAVIGWGYVVGYLGLGRLVIALLRRWMYVSLSAGSLVHLVLVLAGVGIPLTLQMSMRTFRNQGYTLLQMTNVPWTMAELFDRGAAAVQAEILVWIVPGVALLMLLANQPSAAAELQRHRIAPPGRVVEEEQRLRTAVAQGPVSPWDEPDADELSDAAGREPVA